MFLDVLAKIKCVIFLYFSENHFVCFPLTVATKLILGSQPVGTKSGIGLNSTNNRSIWVVGSYYTKGLVPSHRWVTKQLIDLDWDRTNLPKPEMGW